MKMDIREQNMKNKLNWQFEYVFLKYGMNKMLFSSLNKKQVDIFWSIYGKNTVLRLWKFYPSKIFIPFFYFYSPDFPHFFQNNQKFFLLQFFLPMGNLKTYNIILPRVPVLKRDLKYSTLTEANFCLHIAPIYPCNQNWGTLPSRHMSAVVLICCSQCTF